MRQIFRGPAPPSKQTITLANEATSAAVVWGGGSFVVPFVSQIVDFVVCVGLVGSAAITTIRVVRISSALHFSDFGLGCD